MKKTSTITKGNPQAQTPVAAQIQSELIHTLYLQGHIALLGVIATASGIAIVFYDHISSLTLFSWLLSIYVLSIIRYFSIRKFKSINKSATADISWGWKFSFFTFLSGLTWGTASIIFFTPENIQFFNILALIIIALSMGSLVALAAFPFSYYVFIIPAMSPMIWRYLTFDDSNYFIFGLLLIVFNFALISFSRVNHRLLHQSVKLRFEKTDLICQLTDQKEKAVQANLAKTKFLASASHDLRQPLHAIGLFLGILINKVKNNEQKKIVHKIQSSTNTLNSLLDSLLDISKLDAGIIQVSPSPFSVNSLFDSLRNEFEPFAIEKNLKLQFIDSHLWINSDCKILDRIIRNLLSNAIRYTSSGGIAIGIRRIQEQFMIAVYDTGIGIQKSNIQDIFIEFHQLHNPERDQSKGLGLGLAIAKRMTELLGMSLSIRSVPGKGSMFGLLLDQNCMSHSGTSRETLPVSTLLFNHKRALIVDDDLAIRDSLSELLISWQCQVITASSGDEALHLLKRSTPPDIIIADYRLRNHETGNKVIQMVQGFYNNTSIPAIIVTGDTAPDRIKEANKSGYGILHKPVSPDIFRLLLSSIFNE